MKHFGVVKKHLFVRRWPDREVVRWALIPLALTLCCQPSALVAQSQIMVFSCPGVGPLPVRFQVDCSHLTDSASKQLCRPFIESQACKVFPAYQSRLR